MQLSDEVFRCTTTVVNEIVQILLGLELISWTTVTFTEMTTINSLFYNTEKRGDIGVYSQYYTTRSTYHSGCSLCCRDVVKFLGRHTSGYGVGYGVVCVAMEYLCEIYSDMENDDTRCYWSIKKPNNIEHLQTTFNYYTCRTFAYLLNVMKLTD